MDISNIVVVGRLTKDAERFASNGKSTVCRFSVACNGFKDDKASFFNCALFGKKAESLHLYLKKGLRVCVTGEMRQSHYTKDGQERVSWGISVRDVQFLGEKSDQVQDAFQGSNVTGIGNDDDIPF